MQFNNVVSYAVKNIVLPWKYDAALSCCKGVEFQFLSHGTWSGAAKANIV